jgi:short subunit dehydrogenase-like uncharacterized protein
VIVLYGATGYTGRLTAAALCAGGCADLVCAGRDPRRVEVLADSLGVTPAVAPVHDGDALRRIFRGAAVVISCAGPFVRVGRPVAEAAVDAGAHYLDSTGEPSCIRWAQRMLHAPARAARRCAIPAGGFDYVPADAAASLLLRRLGPLRRIDYVYVTGRRSSAGTRRSAIAVLRDGGWVVRGGRALPAAAGSDERSVAFTDARRRALLAPLADPLLAHRRLGVEEATSWVVARRRLRAPARVARPVLRHALRGPVREGVDRLAGRSGSGPSPEERQSAPFVVRVEAVGRLGGRAAVELRGTDVYGVTARALAWRALRLRDGDFSATGVLTPAEDADPLRLLRALEIGVHQM